MDDGDLFYPTATIVHLEFSLYKYLDIMLINIKDIYKGSY